VSESPHERSVRHRRPTPRVAIGFPKTIGLALVVVALLSAAIAVDAAAHCREGAYWRTGQAESITTIRGMRVRVHECRGLGRAIVDKGVRRYRHFRCDAATRAPGQTYDTVTVLYVLHPLVRYVGPRSGHRLTKVEFIGGPGIP
jgi:hypothetical protein